MSKSKVLTKEKGDAISLPMLNNSLTTIYQPQQKQQILAINVKKSEDFIIIQKFNLKFNVQSQIQKKSLKKVNQQQQLKVYYNDQKVLKYAQNSNKDMNLKLNSTHDQQQFGLQQNNYQDQQVKYEGFSNGYPVNQNLGFNNSNQNNQIFYLTNSTINIINMNKKQNENNCNYENEFKKQDFKQNQKYYNTQIQVQPQLNYYENSQLNNINMNRTLSKSKLNKNKSSLLFSTQKNKIKFQDGIDNNLRNNFIAKQKIQKKNHLFNNNQNGYQNYQQYNKFQHYQPMYLNNCKNYNTFNNFNELNINNSNHKSFEETFHYQSKQKKLKNQKNKKSKIQYPHQFQYFYPPTQSENLKPKQPSLAFVYNPNANLNSQGFIDDNYQNFVTVTSYKDINSKAQQEIKKVKMRVQIAHFVIKKGHISRDIKQKFGLQDYDGVHQALQSLVRNGLSQLIKKFKKQIKYGATLKKFHDPNIINPLIKEIQKERCKEKQFKLFLCKLFANKHADKHQFTYKISHEEYEQNLKYFFDLYKEVENNIVKRKN